MEANRPCVQNHGLSNLESEFHQIFSTARTTGEDYVYVATKQLFNIIDSYCLDEESKKPPLLIIGESGSGKSALLSNWLSLWKKRKGVSSPQSSVTADYVFWHAVGSSRQSCDENSLILRLILDLKEKFDIVRDIPVRKEKLRWVISRFIEIAARKGRIILIIDGINRLVTNEYQSVLSWLPFNTIPNLKVILTATIPKESPVFQNSKPKDYTRTIEKESDPTVLPPTFTVVNSGIHLLRQLERKQLQVLRLRSLDRKQVEKIINDFIQKTVEIELSTNTHSIPSPGFLLFPCHIKSLLQHSCSRNAQFLRLFLNTSYMLCNHGFSVWLVWDQLLQATDSSSLLKLVLDMLEFGSGDLQSVDARSSILKEGGVAVLCDQYQWHPTLKLIGSSMAANSSSEPTQSQVRDDDLNSQNDDEKKQANGNSPIQCHSTSQLKKQSQVWLSSKGRMLDLQGAAMPTSDERAVSDGAAYPQDSRLHWMRGLHNAERCFAEALKQAAHTIHDTKIDLKEAAREVDAARLYPSDQRVKQALERSSQSDLSDAEPSSTCYIATSGRDKEKTKQCSSRDGSVSTAHSTGDGSDYCSDTQSDTSSDSDSNDSSSTTTVARRPAELSFLANAYFQRPGTHGSLPHCTRGTFRALSSGSSGGRENLLDPSRTMPTARSDLSADSNDISDEESEVLCVDINLQMRHLPQCLTNGETVEGLGQQVIIALSLLLVCRHGLSETELAQLLTGLLHQQAPQEGQEKQWQLQPGKESNGGGINSHRPVRRPLAKDHTSMPPLRSKRTTQHKIEVVISALVSLGVLHSRQHKALVLPPNDDALRQVVLTSYVAPAGGVKEWYGKLIAFFMAQPVSARRCEELPWHLQKDRQWFALRNCLADIKTFSLMYRGSNSLKSELVDYWLTLTHGPMHTTDDASRHDRLMAAYNTTEEKVNQMALENIEAAILSGFTKRIIQRENLREQVAPFDIVQEFNRSLEQWRSLQRPVDSLLREAILLIGKFLHELSSFTDSAMTPPYLRQPIDVKFLTGLGVTVESGRLVSNKLRTGKPVRQAGKQIPTMRTEQLALTNGFVVSSSCMRHHDDNDICTVESFPSPSQVSANLYPYLRWVWVQFAWIALEGVTDIGKDFLALQQPSAGGMGSSVSTLVTFALTDSEKSLCHPHFKDLPTERALTVKRHDPTVAAHPVSPHRVAMREWSLLASRTIPTAKQFQHLDASAYLSAITDTRICALPSHPDYDGFKSNTLKYRRSINEEYHVTSGVPFAKHSKHFSRTGELFAAVERSRNERILELEQKDHKLYEKANTIARLGGASEEPALWERLRQLVEEERVARHNELHPALFVASSDEILMQRETDRLSNLRKLADKATYLRKTKEDTLRKLRNKVEQRRKDDKTAQDVTMSGMMQLELLQSKLAELNAVITKESLSRVGLRHICEVLEKNPPNTGAFIAELEEHVTLAQQQVVDLINFRKRTAEETVKNHTRKISQYENKIVYYDKAREQLLSKRAKYFAKHELGPEEVEMLQQKMLFNHFQLDSDQRATTAGADANGIAEYSRNSSMAQFTGTAFSRSLERVKRNNEAHSPMRVTSEGGLADNSLGALSANLRWTDSKILAEGALTLDFKALANLADVTSKEYRTIELKLDYNRMLEATGVKTEEELLDQFQSGKELNANLTTALSAADERLLLLREECEELQATIGLIELSEIDLVGQLDSSSVSEHHEGDLDGDEPLTSAQFSTTLNEATCGSHSTYEIDNVFLNDKALLEKERKLHQLQEQAEHLSGLLNEAKAGIKTIVDTIAVNATLLHSMPKTTNPFSSTNFDVTSCLLWIEEKLVAVHEAVTMDESSASSSKLTSGSKASLAERQQNIAIQIQDMLRLSDAVAETTGEVGPLRAIKLRKISSRKETSSMSSDFEPSTKASKIRVLIQQKEKKDAAFERQMAELHRAQDRSVLVEDKRLQEQLALNQPKSVNKFLNDALAKSESKKILHKAKHLSRQLQRQIHTPPGSADAGFGFTIQSILGSQHI